MPNSESIPVTGTVLYAHDKDGKAIAHPLIRDLGTRGVTVRSDFDFQHSNPASLQASMMHIIIDHPTIVVLSDAMVRRFANADGSPEHKGVLFESYVLLMKMYRHIHHGGCPVIPVATREFSADRVPHVLARLEIARYDPETGEGVDDILARLRALHASGNPAPIRTEDVAANLPGERRGLRDVVNDLMMVDPTSNAGPALVREWLTYAADDTQVFIEFVTAFPAVERIVKAAGDPALMREVADVCLRPLNDDDLVDVDDRVKAMVLICGRSWHLSWERDLSQALKAVNQGIGLARACHDQWVVALGTRWLARIHRALAEDTEGSIRNDHLRNAVRNGEAALRIFEEIDSDDHEKAISHIVLARIHFARYRLRRNPSALRRADTHAKRAASYVHPDLIRSDYELLILRAEIATAVNDFPLAQELIAQAIEGLGQRQSDGASYVELLGRAYLARARLRCKRGERDYRVHAGEDVNSGLATFERLGLVRPAADCEWTRVTLGPESHGLTWFDVKYLEKLCPDPRERLLAVQIRRQRIKARAGSRWSRRAEWRDIVRTIRKRRTFSPAPR